MHRFTATPNTHAVSPPDSMVIGGLQLPNAYLAQGYSAQASALKNIAGSARSRQYLLKCEEITASDLRFGRRLRLSFAGHKHIGGPLMFGLAFLWTTLGVAGALALVAFH